MKIQIKFQIQAKSGAGKEALSQEPPFNELELLLELKEHLKESLDLDEIEIEDINNGGDGEKEIKITSNNVEIYPGNPYVTFC